MCGGLLIFSPCVFTPSFDLAALYNPDLSAFMRRTRFLLDKVPEAPIT
jgi:hypothetical protein